MAVSVGVEHDSQSVADSSGWKVFGESGYDSAVVSVSLANSAPDDLDANFLPKYLPKFLKNYSVFRVFHGIVGFVNIGHAFSEIVGGRLSVVHTLDF